MPQFFFRTAAEQARAFGAVPQNISQDHPERPPARRLFRKVSQLTQATLGLCAAETTARAAGVRDGEGARPSDLQMHL